MSKKEYRVKVSVTNNLLVSAIESAGFKSQAEFFRYAGINQTTGSNYVTLKLSPINKNGCFRPCATLIMEALGACPSDLWSDEQMTMELRKSSSRVDMSVAELAELFRIHHEMISDVSPESQSDKTMISRQIARILKDNLTPRQQKTLIFRYGIDCDPHTYEEVGEMLGVQKERVRQIEVAAMRKLRENKSIMKIAECEGYGK